MISVKTFIVDRLLRLPLWLAKPLSAIIRRLWPEFRNA